MAEELTLAQALDEAKRWTRALRSAEKLESVIAVVLRAEALVGDSERALREYDVKIGAKKSEVNTATVQLADVRQRIADAQAQLAAATNESDRLTAAHVALRAAEERKTRERVEALVASVTASEASALERKRLFEGEIASLIEQRDAIKADIEALRRKVAGVASA